MMRRRLLATMAPGHTVLAAVLAWTYAWSVLWLSLRAFRVAMLERDYLGFVPVALALTFGVHFAPVVRGVLRRPLGVGAFAGAAAASAGVGYAVVGPFWEQAPPVERRWGSFPFRGSSLFRDERAGIVTHGTILPDGTRDCGATPSEHRVLLVGDSYTYGVGLEDRDAYGWVLQEHLRAAGHDVQVVNLGQPGASLHSYVEALRYGIATWQPDVVMVSLLPINDVRPVDVNDQHRFFQAPWFRVAGTWFGPTAVWDAITIAPEVFRPPGWATLATRWGLDDLGEVAGAAGVALVPEIQATAEEAPWIGRAYEVELARAAERHPAWRVVVPQYLSRPGPDFLDGDGHPSRAGNEKRAAWAVPYILQELDR